MTIDDAPIPVLPSGDGSGREYSAELRALHKLRRFAVDSRSSPMKLLTDERQGFGAKRQVSHSTSRLWSRLPLCPWSRAAISVGGGERRSGGTAVAAVETICFISFISFEMRRGVSRSNLRSLRRSAADDGGGSQLANGRWSLGRSKSLQHTPIAALKKREAERKTLRLLSSATYGVLVGSYLISGLIFYCIQLTRSSSRSFCH